ncbi:hypothetical protein WJX72_003643 [[Myrmecia] bisecta]|uniref:Haloacid dehalogenase-like hydrolase domain-containing protein n=1 Tax=[Myrmecia] bisecta TaxID=41462 RepID=A0AAW1PWK0_9CHLO
MAALLVSSHCCSLQGGRGSGFSSWRPKQATVRPCTQQHSQRSGKWGLAGRSLLGSRALYHLSRSGQKALHICAADLQALIFDCDGVIIESEDLHRRAYNAAFGHFQVSCTGGGEVVEWTEEFYDDLQNKVGGGKPKMRWYFGKNGWPSSTVLPAAPDTAEEQAALIDTLQDWKTAKYQDLIASGEVAPRDGVLRLMDEARAAGLKVAVCSAATKSSVIFVLENLIGKGRFQGLDCFMAGDDVPEKKPHPSIYVIAADKLGVQPDECVVVEDSLIGLQAALGAGMRCVITYTTSTRSQEFPGAERIVASLGEDAATGVAIKQLMKRPAETQDDRVSR